MADIWDIVKTVGSGAISALVPGGGAIISLVNSFLGDDDKLPENATGDQAVDAIKKLPPDKRAEVMCKKIDVDLEQIKQSYGTLQAMLTSNATSTHTTRPYIAKGAFHVIAFAVITVISIFAYGVSVGDADMITAIVDGWYFILAVIGPLVTVLLAYFGVLKQEHRDKLDAAGGNTKPSGIVGAVSSIISAARK